jgi:hypothetical protein
MLNAISPVMQTRPPGDMLACDALAQLASLDARQACALLSNPGVEAVEIPRPALDATAYAGLVRRLLAAPYFMSDFNQYSSAHGLAHLCRRVLGPHVPVHERDALLADLVAIEAFGSALGGPRVLVSIRNWFAPGDLVWHVDRSAREIAYRILWPLGRREGMRITPYANIDPCLYAAFMRREHPLLCRLDREIARTGLPLEVVWRHRPAQVRAMIAGAYPFLRDGTAALAVRPDSVSVHRIDTPGMRGTFHRSAWGNRHFPGLQVILTVTSA